MNVLVLCAYYLPGFKAGGPIKTIAGMVDRLGDEFHFSIITSDRDTQDTDPFPHIKENSWQQVGKAQVYYISPTDKTIRGFRRAIVSKPYDILYLNSFFDPQFTGTPLFLHRLGLIPQTPVIVAPRGEFSAGAINLKKPKKHAYLLAAQMVGLYSKVQWQASSEFEKQDILREFFRCPNGLRHHNLKSGGAAAPDITLAPNILASSNEELLPFGKYGHKPLRIIFLSRITNMKNLGYALNVLAKIQADIDFDIYGPVDRDKDYWYECQRLISKLPKNIQTRYLGPVEASKVQKVFSEYDLFFFPTKGENFGHVILESLSAGCPVLLSDQTPWQDLEEHNAGWVVPLSKPEEFRKIIETLAQYSQEELSKFFTGAARYAYEKLDDQEVIEQNRALFYGASI